jgi:hypothetical protein
VEIRDYVVKLIKERITNNLWEYDVIVKGSTAFFSIKDPTDDTHFRSRELVYVYNDRGNHFVNMLFCTQEGPFDFKSSGKTYGKCKFIEFSSELPKMKVQIEKFVDVVVPHRLNEPQKL